MTYPTLLERCSSSPLAPYDKECVALQEKAAKSLRQHRIYQFIDQGPTLSADNTDFSRMVPYAVKVFQRPATGELIFMDAKTSMPVMGPMLGSVAMAMPNATAAAELWATRVAQTAAVASDAGALAFGGVLLAAGALNSAMPNVQSESFDIMHEAPLVEVGTWTLMKPLVAHIATQETPAAFDFTSGFDSTGGAPVNGPEDPERDEKPAEKEIMDQQGCEAVTVTSDNLRSLANNHLKYVLVRRPGGREEFRVTEGYNQHPQLVLTGRGEQVVAAGFVTISDRSIRVNGDSENFPTETFTVRCANPNLIKSFPAIAATHRTGLSHVVEHLEGIAAPHGVAVRIQSF